VSLPAPCPRCLKLCPLFPHWVMTIVIRNSTRNVSAITAALCYAMVSVRT
jgi:hypothetical protein